MLGFVGFIKKNLDMQGKLPDKWKDAVEEWELSLEDGYVVINPTFKFYRGVNPAEGEYLTIASPTLKLAFTQHHEAEFIDPEDNYGSSKQVSANYYSNDTLVATESYYLNVGSNITSNAAASSGYQAYVYAWFPKSGGNSMDLIVECINTTDANRVGAPSGRPPVLTTQANIAPIAKITWDPNQFLTVANGVPEDNRYIRITAIEKL